jgi:hypothetical protein
MTSGVEEYVRETGIKTDYGTIKRKSDKGYADKEWRMNK